MAREGVSELRRLAAVVEQSNAFALPGCTIKYDSFMTVMWRAVSRGFVQHDDAVFVARGLRWGFEAGIQRGLLHGKRVFRNYKSAIDAMPQVVRATQKRIDGGKSIALGDWVWVREILREEIDDYYVFPLGAVPKPLEPTEVRPASDHTKTGWNGATDMSALRHAITAASDVADLLHSGYFMYVSDVEAAFPMLPLAPWLWWFFLFRVPLASNAGRDTLCAHMFGDFGTRGMPGCFYIFYVRVVIPMARSERVVTLPIAVHVDDNAMIGAVAARVDAEMASLQHWATTVAGVDFKAIKDRRAAQRQLYIGFWWDSLARTRTLDEAKLVSYVRDLLAFASARTATLHDLRSLAGKAQRAVMTMPPGAACLLVNFFLLMAGLTLPWHKRRLPRGAKLDAHFLARMLELNLGRGYFSYDQFAWAPLVLSDASKSSAYAGGGYVVADGRYRFWSYGSSAARNPIDFLEGDTCLLACEDCAHTWRRCMVPFGLDNMSFQRSEARGRSRAPRLNDLLRGLFVLQVQHDFVLSSFWLSSEANALADDLSRDREASFLRAVWASGTWAPGCVPVRHPRCGEVRRLTSTERPDAMQALRQALSSYSSNSLRDGPERGVRFASTVPHARTSLTQGLPLGVESWLNTVLDNRYSASSWRTIKSGVSRWRAVADEYGWAHVIRTDDPERGSKLVTLMHHLVVDTELVWQSISGYLWGVRTYMKLQHQADPAYGVEHWDMLEQACMVLTHVPSEPRAEIPFDVLTRILEALDPSVFWEAQFGFFALVLLFSFSRSECPCPKSFTGAEAFDKAQHWQVKDFEFVWLDGRRALRVRFKAVKQDPRMQRSEARSSAGDEGDWAILGDVPGSVFSLVRWYMALLRHWPERRDREAPFFLASDGVRPYTYSAGMADLATSCARVKYSGKVGLHSFRVSGYNWSKRGNGEDITVAHGLWKSSAHTRYERFALGAVLSIPANMVGEHPDAPQSERPAGRQRGVTRQGVPATSGGATSDSPGEASPGSSASPARGSPVPPSPPQLSARR